MFKSGLCRKRAHRAKDFGECLLRCSGSDSTNSSNIFVFGDAGSSSSESQEQKLALGSQSNGLAIVIL